MKYAHVATLFYDRPLMIMPSKALVIDRFLRAKMAGEELEWEGRVEPFAATSVPTNGGGSIAVLPLYGVMAQRLSMMQEMSGGTSTDKFLAAFREQANNSQVKAIVLDIDSPGGSVYGTDELASEVYKAREQKPIVAVANSLMASAAYYFGSQADELIVTPGGEVGSIGVLGVHYDFSAMAEMEGVKPTLIKAGKYKAEGHPDFPLSDDARDHFQQDVDRYYGMFVRAVARGRGVSVQTVRDGFGEGRVVGAQEAVRLGMADRIATLDETVQRLASGGRVQRRGVKADALSASEQHALEYLTSQVVVEDENRTRSLQDKEATLADPLMIEIEDGVYARRSLEEAIVPDPDAVARDRDLLQLDRDRVGARS
jgi:signal peptide peptidase SppA